VKRHQDQGWQLIGTSFPWVYFKRDLGTPALAAPADPRLGTRNAEGED
jgi:hypothetical protein